MVDIIIYAVVGITVAGIAYRLYSNGKKGISGCGCGCEGCKSGCKAHKH